MNNYYDWPGDQQVLNFEVQELTSSLAIDEYSQGFQPGARKAVYIRAQEVIKTIS